jgi:hypothetical protein
MSVLAGFDVAIEISRSALRNLTLRHFPLAEVPGVLPPYEFRAGNDAASAYVMIRDVDLDLLPENRVAILLTFYNGTLRALGNVACPLAGTIRIEVPVVIQVTPTASLLGLDFTEAVTHVSVDEASKRLLREKLSTPFELVQDLVDSNVGDEIKKYGFQGLDVPLTVTPGIDGSLGTGALAGTRFERVAVHCIPNANDRSRQALVVFGTLFSARAAEGDPAAKTETVLEPGQDVALSISEGAFRRFVFCEGLRQGLEGYLQLKPGTLSLAQVPTPCGGGSLDVDGVTITGLNATLGDGFIAVTGTAEASEDLCYEATAALDGRIALWIDGNSLGATTLDVRTVIRTTVKDVCFLLSSLTSLVSNAAAALSDVAVVSMSELITDNVATAVDGAMRAVVGKPFVLTSLGQLQDVKFQSLRIRPEAISLAGVWPISLGAPLEPYVDLSSSVSQLETLVRGKGVYHVADGCLKGDYAYQEVQQSQMAVFAVSPARFGDRFTTEWSIDCGGEPQKLPPGPGTVTVKAVKTFYPTPLSGGSTVVQDVHLSYVAFDDHLELRNLATEGCFAVTARPEVKNCIEQTLKTEAWAQFNGDVVNLDGSYYVRQAQCLRDLLKGYVRRVPDFPTIHPVPVNYPLPELLIATLSGVVRMKTPNRDQILRDLITAHGSSFARALGAPPALRGNLAAITVPTQRRSR